MPQAPEPLGLRRQLIRLNPVAGRHLNICAILSKLQKHDKAVQHAECALELMRQRASSNASRKTDGDREQQVSQDDY